MGLFGNIIGQAAGALGGGLLGGDPAQFSRIGGDVGGALIPFARGAIVRPMPMAMGGMPVVMVERPKKAKKAKRKARR